MKKIKKVYKYGTGHPIPEGAVYLCTKTETRTEKEMIAAKSKYGGGKSIAIKTNFLVWHYFLVEVDEDEK